MEKSREAAADIMDVFENFLGEKGIKIKNPERDEYGSDDAAILFGEEYYRLEDAIITIISRMMRKKNGRKRC